MIHLVLLSGGSGARLWPLSNAVRSKQFLKVLRDDEGNFISMVQRTMAQIRRLPVELDVTIATGISQMQLIELQIEGEYEVVVEPERRDTAPAIMLACAHLSMEQGASPDDSVIVMPIDTYAGEEFYECIPLLADAVASRFADIVLLGVKPTNPSTKFGYIVPENSGRTLQRVNRFTEKPSETIASALISQGALWNCGVFAFRLGWLESLRRKYLDKGSYREIVDNYSVLPKNSFDYEVVENTRSVGVVEYSGAWKDLGTWSSLTEELVDTCSGQVILDEATCTDVHVVNETNLPVVVAGLNSSIVVATPDGILVSGKGESDNIKQLVPQSVLEKPMREQFSWGEVCVIDASAATCGVPALVKKIVIWKGRRAGARDIASVNAIWVVTSGEGVLTVGKKTEKVSAGSVLKMSVSLASEICATKSDLHVIEISTD